MPKNVERKTANNGDFNTRGDSSDCLEFNLNIDYVRITCKSTITSGGIEWKHQLVLAPSFLYLFMNIVLSVTSFPPG